LNITDWTNQNYNKLLTAAKNISYNDELSQELLHYSLEQLLTKPNILEIVNSGGCEFYIIRIMLNQWRSTTSPFYKIYRKDVCQIDLDSYLSKNDVVDEAPDHSEQIDITANEIQSELRNLGWYDQTLFKLYCDEGRTISSISRETKIPRTSISLSINRVKRHIRSKIKPITYE
jgi:hypothetical protein